MQIIETKNATLIYEVMQQAFAEYALDEVPSSALKESVASIQVAQAQGECALAALLGDQAVGIVRFTEGKTITFFRLSVVPDYRRQGIAKALIQALIAKGKPLQCNVRQKETRNIALYTSLGFVSTTTHVVNHGHGEISVVTMTRPRSS